MPHPPIGSPDSPIAYLPGAGGLGSFWHPVAELLRPRGTPLVFEYPGFGATPRNPALLALSDLLVTLLARLPASFDLVAQSMGCVLALRMALEHPARVRRLVLVAASGGIDVRALGGEEWRDGEWIREKPDMPRWFVNDRSDFTDRLRTLRAPTLILCGDADPLSPPRVGEFLRDHIPGATLEIIEGGTHAMAEECPEIIAQHIERHLGAS